MLRIGLFGGTLDPIHLGHLRSAEEVREAMTLDEIWFLPAPLPPHKEVKGLTPFLHRLAMVERAIAPVEHFKAASIEAERPGISYSIDTLRALRARHGAEIEFTFLLGSDAYLDIKEWREYRRLPELASLVVMGRDGKDWESVRGVTAKAFPEHRPEKGAMEYGASDQGAIHFLEVTHLAISATDIRRRVREGRSVHFLVPEAVIEYMEEHRLYTRSADKSPAEPNDASSEPDGARSRALRIAREIWDNKGEEVVVLDVRGLSDVADYFVIAHGRSTRHVQGIVDNIKPELVTEGIRHVGVEGAREGTWVLMDYEDVVVHLFYQPVREFYDLEGLWSQAPRVELEEAP